MSKINKVHSFKFVKASDFKTVTANGVFGGITVKGQLNMNFYVETIDLPKVVQHQILDGVLNPIPIKVNLPQEASSLREVPFAINLDIDVAKSIVHWMQDHIDKYDKSTLNQK